MEHGIKHIAVIPDGNRRWAREHGLPAFEGHRRGAETTLPDLLEKADEMGIPYMTFWALSPENIEKRDRTEVQNLFSLLNVFLTKRLGEFIRKGVVLHVIGDTSVLPGPMQENIKQAEAKTANGKKITLFLGINYGGRQELVRAVMLSGGTVTAESIEKNLYTGMAPPPDLIIRTGGESRLSGFMLWQCAYSELYFSPLMFPDFTPAELEKAVHEFSLRQRRFGK